MPSRNCDLPTEPTLHELREESEADRLAGAGNAPPLQDVDGTVRVRIAVIVHSDPESVYLQWRDVECAPIWQEQILSVTAKSATRSHWVMKSGEFSIEWEIEIVADEPCKRIAWTTVAGDAHHAGEVLFEEIAGDCDTRVTVLQEFRMDKLAGAWESIAGCSPNEAVVENLLDFKALVENSEIPRADHHLHHIHPRL